MSQSKAMGTLGVVAPTMMLLFTFCVSSATHAIAGHKPPSCIDTPPYIPPHIKQRDLLTSRLASNWRCWIGAVQER